MKEITTDIIVDDMDNEIEEGETDGNLNIQDYPLKEVRIDKGRMSVYDFKRKYDNPERGNIILNPDFQRNDDVWGKRQKSELIESILIGIPLPVIYFFQDANGKKQVVDGRQRLTCIADYIDGKFTLDKLRILSDISGKKFKDLSSDYKNKLEDYQLEIYTILPPTPERVKFDIFDRINRGGTKLSNQEMRNALYQGSSTTLIKELSECAEFKGATDNTIRSRGMKDRYIILRLISFYLVRTRAIKEHNTASGIDEFLAKTMQEINKKDISAYLDLKNDFKNAMKQVIKNGGSDIFRFKSKDDRKRPINMGLFECISYGFMIALENKKTIDIDRLEILKSKHFDNPDRFTFGIDSVENVNFRFGEIEKLIGINNASRN
ncbi:DUF262 domain-containing protein [Campylobacter sp. 19-13652]|uniref:DUF262 domain-containing protein n=1 Tax=Campylobacter sp. 19-13652 TaxID=2840180 RepID=UPI001C791385|nr:DUF262 domain-containing protein [Campylobacter sp. 19-13652]BCX78770.1 hypothetical protein LBC_02320 [Campylobacter sp. 19-13652]